MNDISSHIKILRVSHWVKNLLVFVPIITAHKFTNYKLFQSTLISLFCMSLVASAGYIFNDIHDRESDKQNPLKKNKLIANKKIRLKNAFFLCFLLLSLGIGISVEISKELSFALLTYFALVFFYSKYLKNIVVINILSLSIFYLLRIYIGCIACHVVLSFWLAMFSLLIFSSLATAKKFIQSSNSMYEISGFHQKDEIFLLTLGISLSMTSVLTLGLYLNDMGTTSFYKRPQILWLLVPILQILLSRVWLDCIRGKIIKDPIDYLMKSRFLLPTCVLFLIIYFLAV